MPEQITDTHRADGTQKQSSRLSLLTTALPVISVLAGTLLGAQIKGNTDLMVEDKRSQASVEVEQKRFEASLALEERKFRSDLVLKAIATDNPEVSTRNLAFLVRAGLLPDERNQILALEKEPAQGPVLPRNAQGFDLSDGVLRAQELLTKLNLYKGPIDGQWNVEIRDAVRKFQNQNGLLPDGLPGPSSLARMASLARRSR